MSGLRAIRFGQCCLRVADSPERSQEIQKLAPLVREINRIHNIGSTNLISTFLDGIETAGATDD